MQTLHCDMPLLSRGENKASLVLAHAYVPPYYAFAAPEANLVYRAFHDLSEDLSARLKAKASAACLQDLRCTTLLREGTASGRAR